MNFHFRRAFAKIVPFRVGLFPYVSTHAHTDTKRKYGVRVACSNKLLPTSFWQNG